LAGAGAFSHFLVIPSVIGGDATDEASCFIFNAARPFYRPSLTSARHPGASSAHLRVAFAAKRAHDTRNA